MPPRSSHSSSSAPHEGEQFPADHPQTIKRFAQERSKALRDLTEIHTDDLANPDLESHSSEEDWQRLSDAVKREEKAFIDADERYRAALQALDARTSRLHRDGDRFIRPDFRGMSNIKLTKFLKSLPGYDEVRQRLAAEGGTKVDDYLHDVLSAVREGRIRVGSDFWTQLLDTLKTESVSTRNASSHSGRRSEVRPSSQVSDNRPEKADENHRPQKNSSRSEPFWTKPANMGKRGLAANPHIARTIGMSREHGAEEAQRIFERRYDFEPNDEDYQRHSARQSLTSRPEVIYDGPKALEETTKMTNPDTQSNPDTRPESEQAQSSGTDLSDQLRAIQEGPLAGARYNEKATEFTRRHNGGEATVPSEGGEAEKGGQYQAGDIITYTQADGDQQQYSVVGPSRGEKPGLILRELNSTRQFAIDSDDALSRVHRADGYYTAADAKDIYKSPNYDKTKELWKQAADSDADIQDTFWQNPERPEVAPFIDYSQPPFGQPGEVPPVAPPPGDVPPEVPPARPGGPETTPPPNGEYVRPTIDGLFALNSERVNDAIRRLAEAKDAREAFFKGGQKKEAFEAAKDNVEAVYADFLTQAGLTSGEAIRNAEYAKTVAEASKATFAGMLERARMAGDNARVEQLTQQIAETDAEIRRLERFPYDLQAALALELSQLRTRVEAAQTDVKADKFAGKFRNWWKGHPKTRLAIGAGLAIGGFALGGIPGIILAGGTAAMRGVGTFMGVEAGWNLGHGWREKFRSRGEVKDAQEGMTDSYRGDIDVTNTTIGRMGSEVSDPKALQEFLAKNNQTLFGPESLNQIFSGDTEKTVDITKALLADQLERISRDAKSARTAKIVGAVAGVAAMVGGFWLRHGGGGRPTPPDEPPRFRPPSPDEARYAGMRASGPGEFGISGAQADERALNFFRWVDKVQAGDASPPAGFNPELLKHIDSLRPKLGFTNAEQFRVFDQLTGDLSNEATIPFGGRLVGGQEVVLNNASRIAELIKSGETVDSLKAMLRAGRL